MRIGLLFVGDESGDIWGSALTTLYLAEALRARGHDVWRASASETRDWRPFIAQPTQLVVAEGVPDHKIPAEIWDNCEKVVLWCLSALFYAGQRNLAELRFHGIATNSERLAGELSRAGVRSAFIELAAPISFEGAEPKEEYRCECVYLGRYPHKSVSQMKLLFEPATARRFALWGHGWEKSRWARFHRGSLPLLDVPRLYQVSEVIFALTEERQKALSMINNRIFEALACGGVVVSDPHPGMRHHELGPFIQFVDGKEEAREFLDRYFGSANYRSGVRARARAGREVVRASHTYNDRAALFEEFYQRLRAGEAPPAQEMDHSSAIGRAWTQPARKSNFWLEKLFGRRY